MAENTNIEWCDHTFNPWTGCTKVSPGCDHCYAEGWSKRAGEKVGKWGPGAPRVRTTPANWRKPLAWNDAHDAFFAQHGRRQRVFCASLADVFDNEVPDEWLADLLVLINATPNLDWLLLTKRIGNFWNRVHAAGVVLNLRNDVGGGSAGDMAEAWIQNQPPENVWLGATVVNQAEADRDIPKLLATPTRVRFLSMEPLLGSVDLTPHLWGRPKPCRDCPKDADCECGYLRRGFFTSDPKLHWVIAGAESGHKARPSHPDWFRSLRDQCAAAGVPFFMKQMGGVRDKRGKLEDLPEDLSIREFPHG